MTPNPLHLTYTCPLVAVICINVECHVGHHNYTILGLMSDPPKQHHVTDHPQSGRSDSCATVVFPEKR